VQALHPSKTASHLVMKANKKEKRKKKERKKERKDW
jgi:hypothetical protein